MEEHFPKMIPKHCEVCKRTEGLLRCGGCSSRPADSQGHVQDYKDSKAKVREEEAKLRANTTGDSNTPPDVLDTELGNLWIWRGVRPYLQALFAQGEMLIRSWRRQGIEDALDLYLELLRLNKPDNQGARFLIPALYVRLGRDQEAYDFCKAWGLHFKGLAKEFDDPNLAYLHIKDADAIEAVDLWTDKFIQLTHATAVLSVKVRLLQGLQAVQQFKAALPAGAPVPSAQKLLAAVRNRYCGDILERRPELIADDDSIAKNIGDIADQMVDLFIATGTYNTPLWPMVLDPEERDFSPGPVGYTHGSPQEAHMAFMYTYPAWPRRLGLLMGCGT